MFFPDFYITCQTYDSTFKIYKNKKKYYKQIVVTPLEAENYFHKLNRPVEPQPRSLKKLPYLEFIFLKEPINIFD